MINVHCCCSQVQKVQDPATLINNFKLYLEEVAKENGKK